MSEESKQDNKDNYKADKIEGIAEKIRLDGINVKELLNPKLIEKFKENNINLLPFLIGIDVEGSIITISHHEPEESEQKVLHIECRSSSGKNIDLEKVTDTLKKAVK